VTGDGLGLALTVAFLLVNVALLVLHAGRRLRQLDQEQQDAQDRARTGLCALCDRWRSLRRDGRMPLHGPCPGGGQLPRRSWPSQHDRADRPPTPEELREHQAHADWLASPCDICGAGRGALVHRLGGHPWTPSSTNPEENQQP
jgi:hypothetical protein